jgi:hypothetical protein
VEEYEERDQEQDEKQEQRRNQKRLLPTAKNMAAKFASRVNIQCLYYAAFTMIPCHHIPEDLHALMAIVKDICTSLSDKNMPILTLTDKLNFEVASWIPSRNAMTSVSHLLLEDKVGKDGLSSQSTYKDNIEDCDAPGMIVTRLLDPCQPSIPMLNNFYCPITKMLNEMRVQITLKKTLHVYNC